MPTSSASSLVTVPRALVGARGAIDSETSVHTDSAATTTVGIGPTPGRLASAQPPVGAGSRSEMTSRRRSRGYHPDHRPGRATFTRTNREIDRPGPSDTAAHAAASPAAASSGASIDAHRG